MDQLSFSYQSSSPYQNGMNVIGGYPNGYPPNYSPNCYGAYPTNPMNSPFPNPQPPSFLTPGTPLELSDNKGNSMTIPTTTYNPGGATVNQGGFNPLTGVTSQPVAAQGFNPYATYIGNPMYNSQQINPFGISQYSIPMIFGIGQYFPGYGQNQFDQQLKDLLYNEEVSALDIREVLDQVILTEEERNKIKRNNQGYIMGYDYYGRPIYSNQNFAFQQSQMIQDQYQQARENYQKHFLMIAKAAYAYNEEEIDEAKEMKIFDPIPPQPQMKMSKPFNYYTATPEEKAEYEANVAVQNTINLNAIIENSERIKASYNSQKELAFAQIKASHDRMIGVQPGEHYDLKTYMENGYKISSHIFADKAKAANRNGTNKYSRNEFRANLSQQINSPIPIMSKDDEYVTIEQAIKNMYDKNKRIDSIFRSQGQTSFVSEPASYNEAHMNFLKAMQQKKEENDIKQQVVV